MSNLHIRHVKPEDGPTWERLRYALWPGDDETHVEVITAFFQGTAKEPEAVLLAEDTNGNAVAFAELAVRTDLPGTEGGPTGYIEGLYVVPDKRSQGVALSLLAEARCWARTKHCTRFASDRDDRLIFDRNFTATV